MVLWCTSLRSTYKDTHTHNSRLKHRYGSVEITKSDDDDDFEDDSEDDEKERVITHDEEHEPHTKPQPSIPSPRRQDVSSDINFDDFEDVMVPSKLMDDVDLSHDDYDTTIQDEDTAIKHAAEAATRAASHASKLSERALSDVEDLIAIKSTTQKKQEENSTSSSKPKQTNAKPKCLRNSDCRCEQCVMSLQGQNFFAEMERLRM